jgi:hypothetical protein
VDTQNWAVARTLALPYPAWQVEFSRDSRWVAASHVDHGLISLLDLTGRQLARRLVVGKSPRGLAISPDGTRLWVAHQMGETGGVSAIAVTANAVVSSFRVVGETYGMAYLEGANDEEARLVVAAHVPEAQQTGMLYALNLDLTRLISNQPLDGIPYKIHYPPPLQTWLAATPTPAAAPTPQPADSGEALPLSATARTQRNHGLLRGGFRGVLLYENAVLRSPIGKVEAVNRRGRRYPGELHPDGSFEFTRLPWGTLETLSAPAFKSMRMSLILLIPPPTVNGMKICSAVRETTSKKILRFSWLAVISR